MPDASRQFCRFGVFEVDLRSGELRQSGRKVALQEKPFQALVLLLENAGELVTLEQFEERLWPDVTVAFPDNLRTAVRRLRSALGDNADTPRYIENRRDRGYRFIYPIQWVADPSPPDPRPVPYWRRIGRSEALLVATTVVFIAIKPASTRPDWTHVQASESYKEYLEGRGYLEGYGIPDNVDRAIQSFSRAVKIDPRSAPAYAGLGEAYWKKCEITKNPALLDAAQQSCEQALNLNNQRAEAHVCMGTLLGARGEHRQAIEEFQRAVQFDPNCDDAWRGLAGAHWQLRNLAAAETEYRKAVNIRPYWGNYVGLAVFYFYQARYGDAEAQFKLAIDQARDNSELYEGLGGVHVAMGSYDDAISNLNQALAHHRTFGALDNLGTAYLGLGRFGDAIKAYRQALELNRGDHRAYGNLARVTYWAGKPEDARMLYQQAVNYAQQQLNVNGADRNVHIDLAWYYAMLGQKPEALNHLVSAQAMESGKAEFAFIAAIVHSQFGERAGVLACMRRALELGFSKREALAAPELKRYQGDEDFKPIFLEPDNPRRNQGERSAKGA